MPAKPRTARTAASQVPADTADEYSLWNEMVAEATVDKPPFRLPLPETTRMTVEGKRVKVPATTIEIGVPEGSHYMDVVAAQRRGDAVGILEGLVHNPGDRERLKLAMAASKAHFPIVDVIASRVLMHFYGISMQNEASSGNSPAS